MDEKIPYALVFTLEQSIKMGHFINTQQTRNGIHDIFNSDVYRNLKQKMRTAKFVTLTMSTDGAVVQKSPKDKSLWPLQLIVNEIELKERFRRKNIISAAFDYGKTPDMAVFMKSFIIELNEINETGGLKIRIDENGQTERFFVILIAITSDSVAKPYILKCTQHNGHNGCPYCYHFGTVPQGTRSIRYSFSGNCASRTHEESKRFMLEADVSGTKVKGYTGISPVLALDEPFDVVWQVVIDKMHSIDLGVIKRFFDVILDKNNKNEA